MESSKNVISREFADKNATEASAFVSSLSNESERAAVD